MSEAKKGVAMHGGVFRPSEGARPRRPLSPGPVRLSFVVRKRRTRERLFDHPEWSRLPGERRRIGSVDAHHAVADELRRVRRWAERVGLSVAEVSQPRRTVVVEGDRQRVGAALGIEFVDYRHEHGDHRGFEGQVHLPAELAGIVEAVLGLHTRPFAAPRLPDLASGTVTDMPVIDLADIYRFPDATDGAGQKIAIIELGGGYDDRDLVEFFSSLNLVVPSIRDVSVGDATRQTEARDDAGAFMRWLAAAVADPASATAPPSRGGATVEVTMDIEIAGALAPGAELIVYFAPHTDQGLFDALHQALDDGVGVISFSWSWDESGEPLEAQIDDLLERAALQGVTFCVGSGDRGAAGNHPARPEDRNAQFPATSPWALGCGGTRLEPCGTDRITESVWNTAAVGESSGGGVSRFFPQPLWQAGCQVPARSDAGRGRGVPDVAAVADPQTHGRILVGGEWGPAAGTSASAPIWAALVARLNQALDLRLGYVNPLLYRLSDEGADVLNDVTIGSNDVHSAREGWDACTGLGTPVGDRLAAVLRGDR